MKSLKLLTLSLFLVLFFGVVSRTHAGSMYLAWDAPSTTTDGTPLTDLAGYKIYYGQTAGIYTSVVNAGQQTQYPLATLLPNSIEGQTYYFAVTAYDTAGNESDLSNEVNYTIPWKDTDGDGLLDKDENNIYGTNPTLADTDGDGLSDYEEIYTSSTSPLVVDTDGDRLSDSDELYLYGTSPTLAHTISQDLNDGELVAQWGDRWNADDDGDGLINLLDPDAMDELITKEDLIIIVDNTEATFRGTWSTSKVVTGYWGENYHFQKAGAGQNVAVWTPALPYTGLYNVYARWTSYPNRATNAKYEIVHAQGSEIVEVNQTQNGGQWVFLGTYPFRVGSEGFVQLSDDANNYVIADAIQFELEELLSVEPIVVDNTEATFRGTWSTSKVVTGYWGENYHFQKAGAGQNVAVWTPALPYTGLYNVYARWTSYPNRATNAKYEIVHAQGSEIVEVNQTQNGGQWVFLGTYPFRVGSEGFVQLSDDANNYVIADAIQFELQMEP